MLQCSCLTLVPVSLGDGLDLVGLRLGRQLDGGDELFLLSYDLLGLDLDLFPSFHHLTINEIMIVSFGASIMKYLSTSHQLESLQDQFSMPM